MLSWWLCEVCCYYLIKFTRLSKRSVFLMSLWSVLVPLLMFVLYVMSYIMLTRFWHYYVKILKFLTITIEIAKLISKREEICKKYLLKTFAIKMCFTTHVNLFLWRVFVPLTDREFKGGASLTIAGWGRLFLPSKYP